MIDNIIEKNIGFLKKHGVEMPTNDDKDIYRYGLQILYSYITNISLIFSVSAILGKLYETAVMVFIFAVFQVFGGGYHAKTKLKCLSLMIAGSIAGNIMISVISNRNLFMAISALVLSGAIVAIGPVTNVKHPVSKATYNRSKLISRIAVFLSLTMVALMLRFDKNIEAAAIVSTLYLYIISLLTAKLKTNKI